jgi:2,4-dienoyl-CoA reductase-like NADH-dependent reductase (Old Yellow Enzyme family)
VSGHRRGAIVQVRRLRDIGAFRDHCGALGIEIGADDDVDPATLAAPLVVGEHRIGNRFCILPMEGWDATRDGRPSDLVVRRWRRFGGSGAKLVWGGEAVAVRADGRANPNQLLLTRETVDDLADLRRALVDAHEREHGTSADLLVGLQLTHSGRWSRPDGPPAPRTAYRHPVLDERVGATHEHVLTDAELDALSDELARAAGLAARAGFAFVDVKTCHGYLGHELLSGVERPGPYGGDLEGRSRFLRRTVEAIRAAAPGLDVAVRLSAYDFVPFAEGAGGRGEPVGLDPYPFAFGGDGTGTGIDLAEPDRLLDRLAGLGVRLVCITAGSPYYVPHIQRPALFPPSDGYLPPEDPLAGVARLLDATRELKARHPALTFVGSGYSYLQEFLPHVAHHQVRTGAVDCVGLGRIALSYPALPADVLAGRPLDRHLLCRTFSDCTTAPRNGLVSGCYPLDAFYKSRPERHELTAAKRAAEQRRQLRRAPPPLRFGTRRGAGGDPNPAGESPPEAG